MRAALAFAKILLALAPAGCTSPGDDPGTPIPIEPAGLYLASCARCHGADGRGDPQVRLSLPVRDFTDPAFRARATTESIEQVVMAGKGTGMPAFGNILSQPKIQSVAGYVKRLAAGIAEPPSR